MASGILSRLPLLLLTALLMVADRSEAADSRAYLRWLRSAPMIDSVIIEGNRAFTTSEIRSRLYSRPPTIFRTIRSDRRTRIQRETVNRDTLEVRYLYVTNGYLQVRVAHSIEQLPDPAKALVRITIQEGVRYLAGEVALTGDYPSDLGLVLSQQTSVIRAGDPINLLQLQTVAFNLKTVLANSGYPYANVSYRYDSLTAEARSPITYAITTDSLVRFGPFSLTGNSVYPATVATRELVIDSGDVYSRDAILRSQRRLYESGFFTNVQIEQQPSSDRYHPEFVVRLRERKPRFLTFQTGAAQSTVRDLQWDASVGIGKRNLFGSRRIELKADYSFGFGQDSRLLEHSYKITYGNPWLFDLRLPFTLGLEWNPPLKDPVGDFEVSSVVGTIELRPRFSDKLSGRLGAEYIIADLNGLPDEFERTLGITAVETQRRKLFGDLIRDSRTNLFVPDFGSLTTFAAEGFGGLLGGDGTFVKIRTSWARYQRIWPGWIWASRISGGWAQQFGDTSILFVDEFQYVGGANSVRGFAENELGPISEDGSPAGARYILFTNQEFRWKTLQLFNLLPLVGPLFETLPQWQSLFVDVGNGFATDGEITFDNLAYVFGTGLQLHTPAGPIRLDYARVIPTSRFPFQDRWHFTILYAF